MFFEFLLFLGMTLALLSLAAWGDAQLTPEAEQAPYWRAQWPWVAKGFGAPALLWALINFGLSFQVPPFFPRVQLAQLKGLPWVPLYLHFVLGGFVVIAALWAGFTLTTRLLRAYQNLLPEFRLEFHAVCFTTLAIMGLPALGLLFFAGWLSLGLVMLMLAVPIIHYGGSILIRPKPRPMYSRALARLKRGRYSEAETEILQQLEKAENDFDGWMLLAELHAVRFSELAEAEQIILDVCLDPTTTPSQVSVALHKLADWQIQLTANPEGAARTLKLISDRLPGTHLAHMAELRRAQLPTNADFAAEKEGRPIALRHVPNMFELTEPPAPLLPEPAQALARVEELTQLLHRDPNHVAHRESLACLLAAPLGETRLAIEQIQLLLGLENQPPAKRLEWWRWLAAWQLTGLRDDTAAAVTLAQIVAEFPESPQAFAAQSRLKLMNPGPKTGDGSSPV